LNQVAAYLLGWINPWPDVVNSLPRAQNFPAPARTEFKQFATSFWKYGINSIHGRQNRADF